MIRGIGRRPAHTVVLRFMSRYKQGRALISRRLKDHRELYYPLRLPLLPPSCVSLIFFFLSVYFSARDSERKNSHSRSSMLRTAEEESMQLRIGERKSNANRTHARTHRSRTHVVASAYFFLPIFIISVFRKFGQVAQHRSRFGSHIRDTRSRLAVASIPDDREDRHGPCRDTACRFADTSVIRDRNTRRSSAGSRERT